MTSTTTQVIPEGNLLNINSQRSIVNISTSKSLKKKKNTDNDKQRQEAYLIMKQMYDNRVDRDECQIFGELVAKKIRKLNTDYAKEEVQHLI